MIFWDRDTPWRQGHILSEDALKELSLVPEESIGNIAVVISHDCDLAQLSTAEPNVEVLVGQIISSIDGNFSYAKNSRRLHLEYRGGTEQQTVDLSASAKASVPKGRLAQYSPVESIKLLPKDRGILQRWLAARYRRSAFQDEFDRRLNSTGLRDRLSTILKTSGALISAVYFDVDEGRDIPRVKDGEPYRLGIYLVYSTNHDPEASEKAANVAKSSIEKAFREKCHLKSSDSWKDFELSECVAMADRAITVWDAEYFQKWYADHISLKSIPPQVMMKDE